MMPHRGLVPVCVPDRGALGFGASADLVSEHLVAQRRAVLVDQRSASAAVAHPVHESAKAGPDLTGQRVTGMPQVVKVVLSPAPDSRGGDVRNPREGRGQAPGES